MNGQLRNMTSIYILDRDAVLLLYRVGSRVVPPSWCGIGGHFEKDELNDARACVLRELNEEMRLTEDDLENLMHRYVTLRLRNGEIRINHYFFARLRQGAKVDLVCDEGRPAWMNLDQLQGLDMPFTSRAVLQHYLSTGRHTDCLYCGCAAEDGVRFEALNEF